VYLKETEKKIVLYITAFTCIFCWTYTKSVLWTYLCHINL